MEESFWKRLWTCRMTDYWWWWCVHNMHFHLPKCMHYPETGFERHCCYKLIWNVFRNIKAFRMFETAYRTLQQAFHAQTLVISVQVTAIISIQLNNRLQSISVTPLQSTAKIKLLLFRWNPWQTTAITNNSTAGYSQNSVSPSWSTLKITTTTASQSN